MSRDLELTKVQWNMDVALAKTVRHMNEAMGDIGCADEAKGAHADERKDFWGEGEASPQWHESLAVG